MNLGGEVRIEAPRERVWAMLNDPEVLRACIPGCEQLTSTGDAMTARVTTKIGPVKATFDGVVRLVNVVAPVSYRIEGEGKGGIAGFASGGADVRLDEAGPNATVLSYVADAKVGGKLAQLGGRLIESTAKKLSDQFFSAFAAKVEAAGPAVAAPGASLPPSGSPSVAPAAPVPPVPPIPPVPPVTPAASGGFASFASAGLATQVDAALGSPAPSGPSQAAGAIGGASEASDTRAAMIPGTDRTAQGHGAAMPLPMETPSMRSVDAPGPGDRASPYHDGEAGGARDPNLSSSPRPADPPTRSLEPADFIRDQPADDAAAARRNAAADQGGILSHDLGDMAVGAAAHTTTGLNIPPAPPSGRVNDDRLLSPAEDTEERIETAAGQGLLGGPMMWGFIALAVVIVLIYALT